MAAPIKPYIILFWLLYAGQMASNCPENHFSCINQKCVSGDSLCNGNNDCGDNSDETIGCKGKYNKLI